jgi:hypothetical protein
LLGELSRRAEGEHHVFSRRFLEPFTEDGEGGHQVGGAGDQQWLVRGHGLRVDPAGGRQEREPGERSAGPHVELTEVHAASSVPVSLRS